MPEKVSTRIQDHFIRLTDPRRRKVLYPLINVVTIAICAVICGADDFVAIADYGRKKRNWLSQFLDLKTGIPSHDRFNAILGAIKPAEFEACLLSWMTTLHKITAGQVVAIDGKTLCGTREAGKKTLVHMVSAWASANNLVLAQRKVDEKSNEITAIPKLLDALELTGTVVTIDAMGCQRDIAQTIIDKKADYILALKGNQGTLREDVELFAAEQKANGFSDTKITQHKTVDGDHGRIETRTYTVIHDVAWLQERHQWPGLQGVVIVESEREIGAREPNARPATI